MREMVVTASEVDQTESKHCYQLFDLIEDHQRGVLRTAQPEQNSLLVCQSLV